jgi:D-arabinonate dehydratase
MKILDIISHDRLVGKVLGKPIFRDAINIGGELVTWQYSEIITDEGISGYFPAEIGKETMESIKQVIVGSDPMNIQWIWQNLYWCFFNMGRSRGAMRAISWVDVGLWDVIGKKLKAPVYKLLGGYRDKVPGYGSGGVLSLSNEELVREQLSWVEEGFKAVKMKVGRRDWREDIARVKAVRDAIGYDIDLMVDANNGWSVATAIRVVKRLERFDVNWLEEPVIAEDYEGYARIRDSTDIPIAGGESEYTKWGFKELFTRQCIDIIQADVGRVGGITEYMKVSNMAEAFNLPMCPHGAGVVSAHCVAAAPNGMIVEFFDGNRLPNNTLRKFQEETGKRFMPNSIQPVKGWIDLPKVPGMGFDPDIEAIQEYKNKHKFKKEDFKVHRRTQVPFNNNLFLSI